MKPSERRALDAEKRAREAAAWREKELEKQAKKEAKKEGRVYQPPKEVFDTEKIDMTAPYTKLPEKEIEVKGDGYHRESFWSNHVRLIAFIVGAVVALFVIGPLGYDIYLNVKYHMNDNIEVQGEIMTSEDLLDLAAKGSKLTWAELEAFEHESFNSGKSLEIILDGTNLILRAERNKDSEYPYSVSLISYANGTSVEDIRTAGLSNIESFINSPSSGILSGEDGVFDGKSLTKKGLIDLAEKGASLTWNDFDEYERTVSEGCTVMEIDVGDSGYKLLVTRDKDRPSDIEYKLIHTKCGKDIDIIQNGIEELINEFFKTHSAEK